MDKINKQTLKILKYVKKNPNIDEYKLKAKYPDSKRYIDKLLEELHYIEEELIQDPRKIDGYLMNTYSISDDGLFYIENFEEDKKLRTREKWLERFWGFAAGSISTLLATYVVYKLGFNK